MPDIRADGDRLTFHLAITGVGGHAKLILHCDPDGTVRASIDQAPAR